MISIIIRVSHIDKLDTDALLVETIAPLVGGVVKGLVGHVLIVDMTDLPDIATIASEAGARHIKASNWKSGLLEAVKALKSDWVLVVDCGVIIDSPFWICAERHMRMADKATLVKATWVSQTPFSLKSILYRIFSVVTLDQAVLIQTKNIDNEIFGKRLGGNLKFMPTRTTRIKL